MLEDTKKECSVLAVIVTYNPDRELLHKNLDAFVDDVDRLLIWDNTPGTTGHDLYREFDQNKIVYIGKGNNCGISKALNFANIK